MKSNIKPGFMKYLSLLVLLVGCSYRYKYYLYNTKTDDQFEVYWCHIENGYLEYVDLDESELITISNTPLICKRIKK